MSFKFKKVFLMGLFIIVAIAVVWLVIQLFAYLQDQEKLKKPKENIAEIIYLEKINDFKMQEFNNNGQLVRSIVAKTYFNFEDRPALFVNPQIKIYNNLVRVDYLINADLANYLDNGVIKFSGAVDISSDNGNRHNINTQELFADTNENNIYTDADVVYLFDGGTIAAQGVDMKLKGAKTKLLGRVVINQDSGGKIITKDLNIDQENGKKHYYSNDSTIYFDKDLQIEAEAVDFDFNKKIFIFNGKADILKNSGAKISTQDLVVEQFISGNMYKTNKPIYYVNDIASIKANSMLYDTQQQIISLDGGVIGRYE